MTDLTRIKTLEVIPSVSPAFGGPSEVVINLTREIRALGIDAEIATTNDNSVGVMDVPLGQKVIYRQVPIWFFPRIPLRLKEFLFSTELTYWLWKNVKHYDLAIAHYLYSYPPNCLAAIARAYHVPYSMRTIGMLTPWALSQGRLKKEIYTAMIERRNLNKATYIHCTGPAEAQDVSNFGIKTPKVVIPLGVNPPVVIANADLLIRQQFGINKDVPIILFMSRLHPKKRLDLLIQVLGKLRVEKHSFHLIVAGSGENNYVQNLHTLVEEYQLNAHITFAGFVTGKEKDLLLQGSDLFVLPSYSENFGIVLAEAMAAATPVITTHDVQISADIAQAQAGLLIENEDQLQNAIIQLLQSPQRRKELGENGRRLALQKYSWTAIAKQFAEVYSQILDNKPLPQLFVPKSLAKL